MSDEEYTYSAPNVGGKGGWSKERLAMIPEYKSIIVSRLREGIFISEIAEELDMNPRVIRKWRDEDLEFRARCDDAEEYYIDKADRELAMRALHGVAEVILNPQTKQIVMDARHRDPVTGISTTPLVIMRKNSGDLQFYLRHKRPDVYGEKKTIDANVSMDVEAAAKEFDDKLDAILRKAENQ